MSEILYEVKAPKSLTEMTWAEVADALKETNAIIVPVGSTENHGPHLPLGTDTLQTIEMVRRIVVQLEKEGVRVLAGPAVPFGLAPYHMDFPGTINLRPQTFIDLLEDVCQSLSFHGFKNIYLFLGHGGNWGAMQVVAHEMTRKTDSTVVALNWLPYLHMEYPKILKLNDSGHAGEGETSRSLVCHPKLVLRERMQPNFDPEKAEEMEGADHPLIGGGVLVGNKGFKYETPIGSMGDPTAAEVETGEKIYDVITKWGAYAIKKHLGR